MLELRVYSVFSNGMEEDLQETHPFTKENLEVLMNFVAIEDGLELRVCKSQPEEYELDNCDYNTVEIEPRYDLLKYNNSEYVILTTGTMSEINQYLIDNPKLLDKGLAEACIDLKDSRETTNKYLEEFAENGTWFEIQKLDFVIDDELMERLQVGFY